MLLGVENLISQMQRYHQGNKIIISVMGEVIKILEILHNCVQHHITRLQIHTETFGSPLEKCINFFLSFTGGNNRLY